MATKVKNMEVATAGQFTLENVPELLAQVNQKIRKVIKRGLLR